MKLPFSLIPSPKKILGKADENGCYEAFQINAQIFYAEKDFEDAVKTLADGIEKLYGVCPDAAAVQADGRIVFVKDSSLSPCAYKISADGNSVTVFAGEKSGAFYASATLLQMISAKDGALYVPAVLVEDAPDCEFSSLMVDLARDFHPFKYLLGYVDYCFFYKIKVLHLHFTDDQSYTLPSRLYPKLSTPGRSYSFEEIDSLVKYARSRGVQLMPEIDVPGHCTSFQSNYGELFGTDGILLQTRESVDALKSLFYELCEMFPNSKYVHIGGDEAAIAKWVGKNESESYYRAVGIDPSMDDKRLLAERIYANFVNEMANAVFEKGRQPVAWEGFGKCVNDYVRKDLILFSWENYYQTTPELLDAGYRILNGSWTPMYIVTPHTYWPQKDVFDWDILKWQPFMQASPFYRAGYRAAPNPAILGGSLLAWGDHIMSNFPNVEDGVLAELDLILERLPALSENTWNAVKRLSFEDFVSSYGKTDALARKFAYN